MSHLDERLGRLEHKVDVLQADVAALRQDMAATKEDLERFATKEDLERSNRELHAVIHREIWEQRQEMKAEMTSHFGAIEERMTDLFAIMLEAINSRLTFAEAEKIFVKRSELLPGLLA